jgi:hypothetical protein
MVGLSTAALTAVGAELALAYRAPVAAHGDREAEINAALITRFYAEVWNGDRLVQTGQLVATDHVYHDPDAPDVAAGVAGVVEIVAGLRLVTPQRSRGSSIRNERPMLKSVSRPLPIASQLSVRLPFCATPARQRRDTGGQSGGNQRCFRHD